jgi:hypothetical protein
MKCRGKVTDSVLSRSDNSQLALLKTIHQCQAKSRSLTCLAFELSRAARTTKAPQAVRCVDGGRLLL